MLDRLGVTEDEITIVNHWNHVGTGYDTDAERELAAAIYQRQREQRKTHHATERNRQQRRDTIDNRSAA